MQTTSAIWKALLHQKGTRKQYAFDINGVRYYEDSEISHKVTYKMYSEFGIGQTGGAVLTLTNFDVTIPESAEIRRYVRLVNGESVSEWLPKGVFFVSSRDVDGKRKTVVAYDAMRKSDKVWKPDENLLFPLSMSDAVAEFARLMGVDVDPRTVLGDFTMDYPGNEYTIRQMLQFVAAAHGGNFIITDEGKLMLVPLVSAPVYVPEETSVLVTEDGYAITFGGVRIIV